MRLINSILPTEGTCFWIACIYCRIYSLLSEHCSLTELYNRNLTCLLGGRNKISNYCLESFALKMSTAFLMRLHGTYTTNRPNIRLYVSGKSCKSRGCLVHWSVPFISVTLFLSWCWQPHWCRQAVSLKKLLRQLFDPRMIPLWFRLMK